MHLYRFRGSIVILAIALLSQNCAILRGPPPPPPLSQQEIADIISSLRQQERGVHTVISSGRVTADLDEEYYEATFVIIGTREPYRIKMEITHTWGRPLFDILVVGNEFRMVSFPEKRYYVGDIQTMKSPKFIAGMLTPEQLWTLARAYPVIEEPERAVSIKGNQIKLITAKASSTQILGLYPDSRLPRLLSYPAYGVEMEFSTFQQSEYFQYAQKIRLSETKSSSTLLFTVKQMHFNKSLPESVFDLNIPKDFEWRRIRASSPSQPEVFDADSDKNLPRKNH